MRTGAHDFARHLQNLRNAVSKAEQHGPDQTPPGFLALSDSIYQIAANVPSEVPGPSRICHGDLKINNLRFDDAGQGLCLLDLDTLANLKLGLELGDALRSWCNPLGEDLSLIHISITIPAVGNLLLAAPVALKLSGAPTEVTAETVVIREPDQKGAAAQLQTRQEASTVSDSVSSEDIRKSADSSASQVASRVVGATVVGDRFVYVRGLGERYSSTLLHGLPLPSPEPEQHAVPFDIFPAELLSSLSVIKTATPDLPADFAGGAVLITLKLERDVYKRQLRITRVTANRCAGSNR